MNKHSKYFSDLNIELYFDDIKKIKEEKKNETTDNAREKLIVDNLLLVPKVAQKFLGRGVDYLDLVQEGNLALINAANTFDFNYGTMFSTYAVKLITQSISSFVKTNSTPIKLPYKVDEKLKIIEEKIEYYKNEKGYYPSIYELADETNSTIDSVVKILILREGFIRFDSQLSYDDNSDKLYDFLEDKSMVDPLENVITKETTEEIREILSSLEPEKRKLILERCGEGSGSFKSKTLKELAEEHNVSSETIRIREGKIKKKIMKKAKKYPGLVENVIKKG